MKLNENDDKHEVARQKIIQCHFRGGEKNIETFVGMSEVVVPHALAWVGRNTTGFSLMYTAIRSLHTLFDCNKARLVTTRAKRKIES